MDHDRNSMECMSLGGGDTSHFVAENGVWKVRVRTSS